MLTYIIKAVDWHSFEMNAALTAGWEPFAVTTDKHVSPTIWLRKAIVS